MHIKEVKNISEVFSAWHVVSPPCMLASITVIIVIINFTTTTMLCLALALLLSSTVYLGELYTYAFLIKHFINADMFKHSPLMGIS